MSGVGGSKFQELMRQRRDATEAGAAEEHAAFNPADYQRPEGKTVTLDQTRRQAGFTIAMIYGRARHWIGYHSIRRLCSFEFQGKEYLEFTHENLAVTIEGRRLDHLLYLIGEGRVKVLFEPDGAIDHDDGKSPQITAMRVTDVEEKKDKDKDSLKLVK